MSMGALTEIPTRRTAARTALKRKKAHEHALEQTMGQISTLEQQINAIESANINRETLKAMEKAREAMTAIHGPLTVEKVDATMYALTSALRTVCPCIMAIMVSS